MRVMDFVVANGLAQSAPGTLRPELISRIAPTGMSIETFGQRASGRTQRHLCRFRPRNHKRMHMESGGWSWFRLRHADLTANHFFDTTSWIDVLGKIRAVPFHTIEVVQVMKSSHIGAGIMSKR